MTDASETGCEVACEGFCVQGKLEPIPFTFHLALTAPAARIKGTSVLLQVDNKAVVKDRGYTQ